MERDGVRRSTVPVARVWNDGTADTTSALTHHGSLLLDLPFEPVRPPVSLYGNVADLSRGYRAACNNPRAARNVSSAIHRPLLP